ncbi:MAG: hypothetical protein IKH45_09130 [Neisseriaceae bacterium]|nr:hypothetical protein [Neisseriaceae bacterium]
MKKTIYILDRNAVSLIKNHNQNKGITDTDLLNELERIDKAENTITPSFSIIEGEHGKPQTKKEEIYNVIKKEIGEIRCFFQKAKPDPIISEKECIEHLIDILLSNEYKKDISNQIEFLEKVNEYIYIKVSNNTKKEYKDKILDAANDYGLNRRSPIVLCTLLCLYKQDNNTYRKIIKPKEKILKENYFYNAVMDFQHLDMMIMFGTMLRCVNYNVQFITRDKCLKILFGYYNLDKCSIEEVEGNLLKKEYQLNSSLLNEIEEEEELKRIYFP